MKKTKANNAATTSKGHTPRPLNLHLLTTSFMLSAAAMPWAQNPEDREKALKAIRDMTQDMMAGLDAYRTQNFVGHNPQHTPIWESGSSRLLQTAYTKKAGAIPVLLVPSLVNRHDILDLDQGHSFAAFLASNGFDPYILEWGQPSDAEYPFTVNDYITQRLYPALEHLHKAKGKPHVIGYCMGGTMSVGALAASPSHAKLARSLTLLAAPWDFQAGDNAMAMRMQAYLNAAAPVMEATKLLPVDWIQALFASIDPLFAFNKFRAFAEMDKQSPEARRFVLVENWLNDGVDLTAPAARQALDEWYIQNQPVSGVWTIGAGLVDASQIKIPTLVVAASKDRLVPKESAHAIMQQIDACTVLEPEIGHIGMMASPRAVTLVWEPLLQWLSKA